MANNVYVVSAKVYDELRKQISFNKMVSLFCVIGTLYILKAEERNRKNEKRITALEDQKGE